MPGTAQIDAVRTVRRQEDTRKIMREVLVELNGRIRHSRMSVHLGATPELVCDAAALRVLLRAYLIDAIERAEHGENTAIQAGYRQGARLDVDGFDKTRGAFYIFDNAIDAPAPGEPACDAVAQMIESKNEQLDPDTMQRIREELQSETSRIFLQTHPNGSRTMYFNIGIGGLAPAGHER